MSSLNEPRPEISGPNARVPATSLPPSSRWRHWLIASAVLVLLFSPFLYALARFSFGSTLYSHLFLIPAASAYLGWQRRRSLPSPAQPSKTLAAGFATGGVILLAVYAGLELTGARLAEVDSLCLSTAGILLLFVAVSAWILGGSVLRALAFPFGFLVFMLPMPAILTDGIEVILQHGSAWAAAAFFKFSDTPLFRQDLVFELPGITLQIAPQCSGIHSSLALFITSIAAGQLFLRSPWKRVVLAAAVFPLALLRNGFRVFVLGELCVRISPDMIHSFIHHQGGPIFFALSLIPFSLLLLLLVRSERRRVTAEPVTVHV